LVGFSRFQFGVFFGLAAGPIDYDFFDFVLFAYARRLWVIRIERGSWSRCDEAGLDLAVGEEAGGGADGVAIGFCADELDADAAISGELVVAIEIGGTVVGG